MDDLPMYGYIGEPEGQAPILGHTFEGSHTYLYPHLHFSIGWVGAGAGMAPGR